MFRHQVKRLYILREARTSVSDSSVQEFGADARVGTDSGRDLFYIRANALCYICNGIDKGNLHREECVGSVLD